MPRIFQRRAGTPSALPIPLSSTLMLREPAEGLLVGRRPCHGAAEPVDRRLIEAFHRGHRGAGARQKLLRGRFFLVGRRSGGFDNHH